MRGQRPVQESDPIGHHGVENGAENGKKVPSDPGFAHAVGFFSGMYLTDVARTPKRLPRNNHTNRRLGCPTV